MANKSMKLLLGVTLFSMAGAFALVRASDWLGYGLKAGVSRATGRSRRRPGARRG